MNRDVQKSSSELDSLKQLWKVAIVSDDFKVLGSLFRIFGHRERALA